MNAIDFMFQFPLHFPVVGLLWDGEIQVWRLTEILLSISLLVQAAEFIYLSLRGRIGARVNSGAKPGVDLGWSVGALVDEYQLGVGVSKLLRGLFSTNIFLGLQLFRVLLCLAVIFGNQSSLFLSLAWSLQLILILIQQLRFRGPFNGGSDMMTLVVLIPITLGSVFDANPLVRKFCLCWIGLQSVLSYFIAGMIKLREPSWRSGSALTNFLRRSYYGAPSWIKVSARVPVVMTALSWGVIGFECLFPLGLFVDSLIPWVLLMAMGFHIVNSITFGLNRFLFAWVASYPGVLFLSSMLKW